MSAEGRCSSCGHDTRVIGHDPRCPVGGIIRQPVLSEVLACPPSCSAQHTPGQPDHTRPAAELTARRRRWFR